MSEATKQEILLKEERQISGGFFKLLKKYHNEPVYRQRTASVAHSGWSSPNADGVH